MPRLIRVIQSETVRGEGRTVDDRARTVVEYHTPDGEWLAERDTYPSFDSLVELVQLNVGAKERERFAKAILETEPLL